LTGDVPGASQADLFGHDARPRSVGKLRPAKKIKFDVTASTGGSSASTQFGELMEQELRLKREAAESAFEALAEKDRTLMRLKELRNSADGTVLSLLDSLMMSLTRMDAQQTAPFIVSSPHKIRAEINDSLKFTDKVPWQLGLIANAEALNEYNQYILKPVLSYDFLRLFVMHDFFLDHLIPGPAQLRK
nr:gamma-tubulin complex component 5-like [Tanacetum cinerariifolium]